MLQGFKTSIQGCDKTLKFLCRNIAPERLIRDQLNLILKNKKMK